MALGTEERFRLKKQSEAEIPALLEEIVLPVTDATHTHVFRGQTNIGWEPIPGLYRRLLNNGYSKPEITEALIKEYEEDCLCEANGLGFYESNRLDTMIDLQHRGGATRLLDVSRDPFIALWFACDENGDQTDGVIFDYAAENSITSKYGQINNWDQLSSNISPGAALLYFPTWKNERVKAQSAGFLTCSIQNTLREDSPYTKDSKHLTINKIIIPSSLKKSIRDYLINCRGMDTYRIYPDFEGYALSNSATHSFARSYSHLYGRSGNGLFPDPYSPPLD
ncbi:MAG: FRG domain-containing protein [Bifidobacterium crudilactis]|nr:FRG domain-containing protein [Bifidobacterium crudilactis]